MDTFSYRIVQPFRLKTNSDKVRDAAHLLKYVRDFAVKIAFEKANSRRLLYFHSIIVPHQLK